MESAKNGSGKKSNRRVGAIDLDTGEMLDGNLVAVPPRINPYTEGFCLISQEGLAKLLSLKPSKHQLSIFLSLVSLSGWGNEIDTSTKQLARRAQIAASHVSAAIAWLESNGVIRRLGRYGNELAYKFEINPDLLWKGKIRHLSERRIDPSQPAWKQWEDLCQDQELD